MFWKKNHKKKPLSTYPDTVSKLDINTLLLNPRIVINLLPDYWEIVSTNQLKNAGEWSMMLRTKGEIIFDTSDPDTIVNRIGPMPKHMLFPFSKGSNIEVDEKDYQIEDIWFSVGDNIRMHANSSLNYLGRNIPYYIHITLYVSQNHNK